MWWIYPDVHCRIGPIFRFKPRHDCDVCQPGGLRENGLLAADSVTEVRRGRVIGTGFRGTFQAVARTPFFEVGTGTAKAFGIGTLGFFDDGTLHDRRNHFVIYHSHRRRIEPDQERVDMAVKAGGCNRKRAVEDGRLGLRACQIGEDDGECHESLLFEALTVLRHAG